MDITVVILLGGLGTRLGKLTVSTPKPLVQVDDKPFLDILLNRLIKDGFNKFIFLVGYNSEQIIKRYDDGSKLGISITYSVESIPLGTYGAIINCYKLLPPNFLVINGDTYTDIIYKDFFEFSEINKDYSIILSSKTSSDKSTKYNLLVKENLVLGYGESYTGANRFDAGVYLIRKKHLVKKLGKENAKVDLSVLFLHLINNACLKTINCCNNFYDIGTPARLKSFTRSYE
jgi:D-glycero-D-manno-heptose 1,7-bisphosphate phosphatase